MVFKILKQPLLWYARSSTKKAEKWSNSRLGDLNRFRDDTYVQSERRRSFASVWENNGSKAITELIQRWVGWHEKEICSTARIHFFHGKEVNGKACEKQKWKLQRYYWRETRIIHKVTCQFRSENDPNRI